MTSTARRVTVARPNISNTTARRARKSTGTNVPPANRKGKVSAELVFRERAEARAILVEACLYDFHDAIDGLQADAVRSGLVASIGQDRVQAIMAAAFKNVPRPEPIRQVIPMPTMLFRI